MTWENYFDSNRAFTVIWLINAALWIPITSPNENFAFYDELQKQ